MSKRFVAAGLAAAVLLAAGSASAAPTEITWWHAMANTLGDWVQDLTDKFNQSQQNCKLVASYKGSYDQTMTSGIAAHRAGRSPNILQVYEVGTATMMYSRGAVVPVGELMKKAGYDFNPQDYIPAVYGYYAMPDGSMMSYPFNSSTTVLYVNLDKFKAQACRPKPTSFLRPGPTSTRPPKLSRRRASAAR